MFTQTPHRDIISSMNKTINPAIPLAIQNFVYSGLSLEQMNKVPKWLIANLDRNVPALKKAMRDIEVDAKIETLKAIPARQETNEWDAVDVLQAIIKHKNAEIKRLKKEKQ